MVTVKSATDCISSNFGIKQSFKRLFLFSKSIKTGSKRVMQKLLNNTDFHKRKIEAKKVIFEDLKIEELEIEEMVEEVEAEIVEEAKEFEKQRSHLEESDKDEIRDVGGILDEDYEDYSKSEAEIDIDCPSFDVDWSKEIHAKYKLRKDYFLTPVFTYGPNNQLRAFRESIILGLIQM